MPATTIWGKGDVTLRRGLDWISGPEAKFQREPRDRLLRRAEVLYLRERLARRGQGDPLRRPRPVRGDRTPSTRAASRRTTTGTCAATRSRSTSCARSARHAMRACYFLGVPVLLHAVARVSAVQRAQVGLPDADDRLHADTRLRDLGAVLLQHRAQLRRDDHAAHHDAARPADRRARVATCSSNAAGEVDRRDRS